MLENDKGLVDPSIGSLSIVLRDNSSRREPACQPQKSKATYAWLGLQQCCAIARVQDLGAGAWKHARLFDYSRYR
jgi:hypothetical protein